MGPMGELGPPAGPSAPVPMKIARSQVDSPNLAKVNMHRATVKDIEGAVKSRGPFKFPLKRRHKAAPGAKRVSSSTQVSTTAIYEFLDSCFQSKDGKRNC